jgi:hypothetical protein
MDWLKNLLNGRTQFDIVTKIKGLFPTIRNTFFNLFCLQVLSNVFCTFNLKIIHFSSKLHFMHTNVSMSKRWERVARKQWRRGKMFISELCYENFFFQSVLNKRTISHHLTKTLFTRIVFCWFFSASSLKPFTNLFTECFFNFILA